MSASERITKTLEAMGVVIKHFTQMQNSVASRPGFDRLAAEVETAIEAAATECEQMLSALVFPVWAELPEGVRAVCEEVLTQEPGA